jgi:glycosyltransferase involved in cell wall biosynthesis
MRLLFVSNLFPNAADPVRGIFNAQQVAALSRMCEITVVAPTARAMPDEVRDGIRVIHPRFVNVPVLSRPWNGWLFARAIEPVLSAERFDVVLANWAYPDAYGVMLVAAKLKFPFAMTAQGSDINVCFKNATRKRQILRGLRASRTVFCRSEALREILALEGVSAMTIYNGIDHERFRPLDRAETCRRLKLNPKRRRVLFVGNLVPVKGPMVLERAFECLTHSPVGDYSQNSECCASSGEIPCSGRNDNFEDVDLVFVGAGPHKITQGCHVGVRPHDEIPLWMNACEVLCLPSLNEGLPNVMLEAMACGLPVVASRVGGVPEVVRDGVNGFLVLPGDANNLSAALRKALSTHWDRSVITSSVAKFDWELNARLLLDTLHNTGCLQKIIASSVSQRTGTEIPPAIST